MIPTKRFVGYRTSVYTKVTWVLAIVPLWGSLLLFYFVGSRFGWLSLVMGILFALVFLYCASVDHARWCPHHGTEKEEEEAIPSSEGESGV